MKSGAKKAIRAITALLLAATAMGSIAFAQTRRTATIEVHYDDIKLVIDGQEITPTDAAGNKVEPFIYNGTTYLPVRAVGNAIGKDVAWDGVEKVVYLGAKQGEENWFDQCKPYQYIGGSEHTLENNQFFTMSGKKYTDGFVLKTDSWGAPAEALFNLDGKYKSLTFKVGHIDGTRIINCNLVVFLDGIAEYTAELKYDDVAKKVTIPLNGALQMKIQIGADYVGAQYGFSEGKFE